MTVEERLTLLEQYAGIAATPEAPKPGDKPKGWAEIIHHVHDGKRVRRAAWPGGKYLEMGDHHPHLTMVDGDKKQQAQGSRGFLLTAADLRAYDWEVCE